MNERNQVQVFDYQNFDIETSEILKLKARAIKSRLTHAVMETGKDLTDAKELIPHGDFVSWVKFEFDMSKERAAEYMRIYEKFKSADSALLEKFGKSALLILSSREVSDETRQEAIDIAESGETISVKKARELKDKAKQLEIENEGMFSELEQHKETLVDYSNKVDDLSNQLTTLCQSIGTSSPEHFLDEIEIYKSKIDEYRQKIDELESQEPETKIVKEEVVKEVPGPEREVIKEVIPDEYKDAKKRIEALQAELDRFQEELSEERQNKSGFEKKFDELKDDLKASEQRSFVAVVLSACEMVVNEEMTYFDVNPEYLSSHEFNIVSSAMEIFDKFFPKGPELNLSGQCRTKLLNDGYSLYRIDEEKKHIRQFSEKGGWKKHSNYKTKKECRSAFAELLKDNKSISG